MFEILSRARKGRMDFPRPVMMGLLLFLTFTSTQECALRAQKPGQRLKGSADSLAPAGAYHSPVKATWMSAACPGLGQMYNKKWWKLPIVYGALGAAVYFVYFSQAEYVKARDSYRALVLPQPHSFQVHPDYAGYDAFQIKSYRDYYRQNRDYAIVATAALYALQILDATVDAHLKNFDVSDKLTLSLRPGVVPTTLFSLRMSWGKGSRFRNDICSLLLD